MRQLSGGARGDTPPGSGPVLMTRQHLGHMGPCPAHRGQLSHVAPPRNPAWPRAPLGLPPTKHQASTTVYPFQEPGQSEALPMQKAGGVPKMGRTEQQTAANTQVSSESHRAGAPPTHQA